jgi:hypothetical protein
MLKATDLLESIDNFLGALSYSYHVDEQELYQLTAAMCTAQANRLSGLDPDRNR